MADGDNIKKKAIFKTLTKRGPRKIASFSAKTLVHFDKNLQAIIRQRATFNIEKNGENVTPKYLVKVVDFEQGWDDESNLWSSIYQTPSLQLAARKDDSTSYRGSMSSGYNNMDDITSQIAASITSIDEELQQEDFECALKKENKMPKFIKILLKETEDFVYYDKPGITVPRESEEAANVLRDNALYEYLTTGKGKNRRTSEGEAQTTDLLFKSRGVNTRLVKKSNCSTFVSNYDMYDTYADLQRFTTTSNDQLIKIEMTTYKNEGSEEFVNKLSGDPKFSLASMVLQRLLAGNVFREKQKRFRNMYLPDPLDLSVKYYYNLVELWDFKGVETMGKAVSSISWCHSNPDLLAVGYGVYNFVPNQDRISGYVCVWSIKNPINPERRYRYSDPVTAVSFSALTPQLLAIGLYNGTVEIRDISIDSGPLVGKTHRSTSPGFEPIWHIKWVPAAESSVLGTCEQILTVSEDGRIMKYNLTSGPFLLGYRQLRLDRVEGVVEGLAVTKKKKNIESDRHSQALCLTIHPLKSDVYFVGTDEGCIHRCSTNYPHQHTGILQVHDGGVFAMIYSPFSPKIFLTCGSDWCIRIWVEDINEPVMVLSSGIGSVHCAYWSPINSTIIIGVTKYHVEIWDIRRSTLRPMSSHSYSLRITLTIFRFTICGRSIVLGDSEGNTKVIALEDMPFPPHFQYNELEVAIYSGLVSKPELLKQVKSIGSLGYE